MSHNSIRSASRGILVGFAAMAIAVGGVSIASAAPSGPIYHDHGTGGGTGTGGGHGDGTGGGGGPKKTAPLYQDSGPGPYSPGPYNPLPDSGPIAKR